MRITNADLKQMLEEGTVVAANAGVPYSNKVEHVFGVVVDWMEHPNSFGDEIVRVAAVWAGMPLVMAMQPAQLKGVMLRLKSNPFVPATEQSWDLDVPKYLLPPPRPVYVQLNDGRMAGETFAGFGRRGPIFGPYGYVRANSDGTIQLADGHVLQTRDGEVYYDQVFYREWSLFPAEAAEWDKATTPFSPDLAVFAGSRTILDWKPTGDGESYQVAQIGPGGDDFVRFYLIHRPTCHRRGPWVLRVEVCEGPNHIAWGCFDEQDQPTRYFHDPKNAMDEAARIATVLLDGRRDGTC